VTDANTLVESFRGLMTPETAAEELYARIVELYPICRSITGNGVRATLERIGREVNLSVAEIATGTRVFDWVVPQEWNIRDAYIADLSGRRIVDFVASTLHVVNYSVPIRQRMTASDLQPRLFSIPDRPDCIPYKTSYYGRTWGFCVTEGQREQLREGEFDVCIDASLEDGHLTFGECVLAGESTDEVLISTHVCHPSLCNDNLSGITVAVSLARLLASVRHRYTYRFLFIPGTIGAITWLALNEARATNIKHGLVLSCLGDPGPPTYKRSRRSDAEIDRAAVHVLTAAGHGTRIREFSPYGYDERQYCSPGFDLAVGSISRTPHGEFPEYHTSADNLSLVQGSALADSLGTVLDIVSVLEGNGTYLNLNPKCEPQLGRRGLYATMGGHGDSRQSELAMLWILNLCDGRHTLLDIAERARLPFAVVRRVTSVLEGQGLLRRVSATGGTTA
jgi:aminopeptidase-like protein